MAGLLDSRWAATPEPTLEQQGKAVEADGKPQDGVFASRWADSTEVESAANKPEQGNAEEKPAEGILASRWADTPEPDAEVQQQRQMVQPEKPKDGVFASRWADTPEPNPEEQSKAEEVLEKPTDGVFASKWAPTPEPAQAQDPSKETTAADQEQPTPTAQAMDAVSGAENDDKENVAPSDEPKDHLKEESSRVVEPVDASVKESEADGTGAAPGDVVQPDRPAVTHLEPPRLRKRVSWRGKNIVISIPRIDYGATGAPKPMSEAEVQERLQQFQDAGYNVLGYDLTHEEATSDDPAQVRAIFPDETESRKLPSRDQYKVLLPDLERWKAYTDWLTEQKLAALGVTLGIEEPPQPQVPAQDMSRQSSQQYPPLPFSPPIPTTSAGSSMSRPGLVRGHSHTMSVASPASPLNGPFGHMHRHSTFTGPIGLPQLQQPPQPQSPGIPGLQPFSPQQQIALSGLPRGGSPAQISALRQELGSMRGPGSPLNQQMLPQSPQDYSRGLVDDQRRRQHAYSQSMQQPMMPNTFLSQGSSLRPTPALPELPEDEDEEDLEEPEPPAYVPPHKRVQANTEIAVPTPRGHRHNISEGLERELLEAEQRQKAASRDYIEVTEEEEQPSVLPFQKPNGFQNQMPPLPVERDPLGSEHPVQETTHSRKKSASRFNVAAPSFTFNPGANFQPGAAFQPAPAFQQPSGFQPPQSTFTFGAPAPKPSEQPTAQSHRRHQSSGSFNANAASFKPATSEFSFSSSGPSFQANAPSEGAPKKDQRNIVDELPTIFGKIDIPDIVKPARRSKAIAIVRPDEAKASGSGTDFEDDEGRVAQGDAKRKQQRKIGDDGDQVPLFAEPGPAPALPVPPEKVLGSNDSKTAPGVEQNGVDAPKGLEAIAEKEESSSPQPAKEEATKAGAPVESSAAKPPGHHHKHSSSLSALAKPFQPPGAPAAENESTEKHHEHFNSISELEEGEIREDGTPSVSPVRAPASMVQPSTQQRDFAPASARPTGPLEYSSNERIDTVEHHEPSFDEIDAVMRQLNADDSEKETVRDTSPARLPSPGSHPMKGVTYLRSDAPSPSLDRENTLERPYSADQDLNGWPQVRQLNRAEEAATSDWSGMLSPPDEEKLHQRSNFFDSHIDSIIGRVVEQRLQPLEDSLRHIQNTVARRNRSSELKLQRSSSNVDSDADDEDEGSDEQKQRPISRGRDKRVDQIKVAVLEALREQSPMRSQTAIDVAELHSVLADMKVSFARAASASLELDDIRAVVEDSLNRQSQAVVPIAIDEGKETHRRELSELEGRLNETLAGALEEANQRRHIEEREAEARRQLRLAEEELGLLRDSARDEDSKARAMEQERQDLIDRLDRSEEARRKAEDKLEDAEAEKDALQATLEEYRVSSNKWRQDIDDGKLAREELENTIASMERQNEEYQESSGGMKRRLEKLHSDMATAAGQLASEKAIWKSKEEDYRAKIDVLESQSVVANRERVQLEDELRVLRATAVGAAESQHTVEHLRATNASLDEMVRKLQSDLTEQQILAVRFERQFHDAQESGRAEVHRTRMSLETEVEAANNHVNLVRAELETELSRVRTELDNAKMEADTAKARHDHLMEEEETARREALRKVNHANSVALDEARHKYESAIQELTSQQSRALSQAFEDKERTESFLKEKLALSDAKLQHFQERVSHLEERLEVAKSAAQAAALSAKASKTLSPTISSAAVPSIPEKVSPQALRESILVLQEQLQERETRIERLEAQVQQEGVAKVKERDTEINWLRELLAVRSEELTELVNTLSRPNFDRSTVRDTAIRIRANLDMEQQEKERSNKNTGGLGGQAIATLSSIASPRLSSAFNKWRESMESSALKNQQRPFPGARSSTPSRTSTKPKPQPPSRYPSGLMTPPASNLRSSPAAEATNSLPPPQLNSRPASKSSAMEQGDPSKPRSRHTSATSERPSTPLFREQSYDRDAEDHSIDMQDMQTFEDDDLEDVADSEPPAFRSLESELEADGGMEEE